MSIEVKGKRCLMAWQEISFVGNNNWSWQVLNCNNSCLFLFYEIFVIPTVSQWINKDQMCEAQIMLESICLIDKLWINLLFYFCHIMFLLLSPNNMFMQLSKATEVCKVTLRRYKWYNLSKFVVWRIEMESSSANW